jgi:small subunit ribosomal protein S8
MLSDPIAYKDSVDVPASKFKEQIAKILVKEGYLASYERVNEGKFDVLRIQLKYGHKREQVIKHIERISRPGRRAYVSHEDLPRIHKGLGLAVVSTSKGLLADRDARKEGIGGEVICVVW